MSDRSKIYDAFCLLSYPSQDDPQLIRLLDLNRKIKRQQRHRYPFELARFTPYDEPLRA
ncbi:MAG: hypothetical protein AAF633_09815 [Chloroflexota bacterium]